MVWRTGVIPQQLHRVIVVLVPKGNSCNFRGIRFMQPVWKIVEGVMERRLQKLECHESLHGGLKGKGMGTAIMDMKMAQELVSVDQDPLLLVFIYL